MTDAWDETPLGFVGEPQRGSVIRWMRTLLRTTFRRLCDHYR